MRFSPYEMNDYTLQTKTTRLSPIQPNSDSIEEGEWNLIWAAIPEIDDFLNLRRDDFKEFNRLVQVFPYKRMRHVRKIYACYTNDLVLQEGSPQDVYEAVVNLSRIGADIFTAEGMDRLIVKARLAMAQSLLDVKEVSVMCKNILTVDFKTRKRA